MSVAAACAWVMCSTSGTKARHTTRATAKSIKRCRGLDRRTDATDETHVKAGVRGASSAVAQLSLLPLCTQPLLLALRCVLDGARLSRCEEGNCERIFRFKAVHFSGVSSM